MMRFRIIFVCTSILLLAIVSACKKTPDPDFHFDYFGYQDGRYVIYDVTEIDHDAALGLHVTTQYQLKTHWGDIYIDNEGREGREFHRYKRNTAADPWLLTDVWTGLYDGIRGELIEENQRVVKLVFAPTYNKVWDANAYNMDGELECYYRDLHDDTLIGGVSFDSTIVVEQADETHLLLIDRKFEMYAKDVGLIYKYYVDNHFNIGDPEVQNGKEIYYTYVSHGIE